MKTYLRALLVGSVAHGITVFPYLLFHGLPVTDGLLLSMIGAPLGIVASRKGPFAVPHSHERFEEIVITASIFPAVFFLVIQAIAWMTLHIRDTRAVVPLPFPLAVAIGAAFFSFPAWVALSWYLKRERKAAEPGATDNPDDAQ